MKMDETSETFRFRRSELYQKHSISMDAVNSCDVNSHVKTQDSEFDHLLLSRWRSAMDKGLFRYTLDHVQTRVIPGDKQFIAQFNDKRTSKRRKPTPITDIRQPFNPDAFNFTKIQPGEVLFKISPEEGGSEIQDNLVIINDSPVDIGHVLLVPRCNQSIPQVLYEDAVHLALDMVLLSNHGGFRVCWNSLGALASVNHLHFHAFYLDYPLLAERITAKPVTSSGCYEITQESTRGFAFQLYGQTVDSLARMIFEVTSYLTDRQVPHNICITKGPILSATLNRHQTQTTIRVLLWPKKAIFGNRPQIPADIMDDPPFLNACIEPAGFLVIKDYDSFKAMTQDEAIVLLGKSSLEEKEFIILKNDVASYLEGKLGKTNSFITER